MINARTKHRGYATLLEMTYTPITGGGGFIKVTFDGYPVATDPPGTWITGVTPTGTVTITGTSVIVVVTGAPTGQVSIDGGVYFDGGYKIPPGKNYYTPRVNDPQDQIP
jgi:hypothetical protein